jgi:hypothetical protein
LPETTVAEVLALVPAFLEDHRIGALLKKEVKRIRSQC